MAVYKKGLRIKGPTEPRSRGRPVKQKSNNKAMKDLDGFSFFVALFASMSSGGIPPSRVVTLLCNQENNRDRKTALKKVSQELASGESLDKAFSSVNYFPKDFCNIVGIGDRTGSLPDALKTYSEYLRQIVTLKKSFKSTLTYPSILVGLISLLFIGAIYFGLPEMKNMALGMGTPLDKLPPFVLNLFAIADLVESISPYIVVPAMLFWVWYVVIGPGKDKLINLLSALFPPVKAIDEKLRWAQWLTLCSMCIGQGAKLSDVMEFLKDGDLPGEFKKNNEYERVCRNYRSGVQLGDELRRIKAPDIISGTLGVAEQQGELEGFMKLIADSYLDTMVFNIKSAGSAVEVAMLIFVVSVGGSLVGTLMLAMLAVTSSVS